MRMLMHVHFPLEPFNTAVRDGSVGQKMKRILEAASRRPPISVNITGNVAEPWW